MRILLTVHQFLPDHSSGTEIIALNIARELRRRGHDVAIFSGYPAKTHLPDERRFDEYTFESMRILRFHHAAVPMGGQSNLIQAEFHGTLFHAHFRSFLADFKPDVVHFIHLARLTSSAIDAAAELQIPCFFTATDFWLICPTNQLLLTDGAMCNGPRLGGANCVQHLASSSNNAGVTQLLQEKSKLSIALDIAANRFGLLQNGPYSAYLRDAASRAPFLREKARLLKKIFVPSHIMQRLLYANGIPKNLLHYLPYGIDTSRITRNIHRGTSPTLRVGFTGTLAEHKGVHILIQAFKHIPTSLPIELHIHGKFSDFPAYVEKLRSLISQDAHAPRIHLHGPYDHSQLDSVLHNLDVLVCPSIWYENTPLVIYEGNAAGIPLVASDLAGMSETVTHNTNGLLFPVGDSHALAQALISLHADRNLLQRLAKGTKVPITVPEHVNILEQFYNE